MTVAAIIAGLIIGSFINVVVWRLPPMLARRWPQQRQSKPDRPSTRPSEPGPFNLWRPGSHCPHCLAPIRSWQNIPLLSFCLQRGRCTACRAPIPLRYPAIELAAGLLSGYTVWRYGMTPWAAWQSIFGWTLLTLAIIDWRTGLLPDCLTLALLWLGLLASIVSSHPTMPRPEDAILGAAVGYLALWLLVRGHWLATGRIGMGHGDFKMAAALGAWLGWAHLPMTLLIAALSGLVVHGLLFMTSRASHSSSLPFGPWLALGGWLIAMARDTMTALA